MLGYVKQITYTARIDGGQGGYTTITAGPCETEQQARDIYEADINELRRLEAQQKGTRF